MPLYMSEAIRVYQSHLGGVDTVPARPAVELRDGMVIGREEGGVLAGEDFRGSGGERTRKTLRESLRNSLRN